MENQTTFTRDKTIDRLTEIWLQNLLENPEQIEGILHHGVTGFLHLSNTDLEIKLEETFQTNDRYVVKD